MKAVIVSDLHVEINGGGKVRESIWPEADVLISAGDLCPAVYLRDKRTDSDSRSCKKALEYMKEHVFPKYRYVIDVDGNHSHYGFNYEDTKNAMMYYFSDVPNYIHLENQDFMIDDVLFIGSTLWTNFDNGNPIKMNQARYGMNDFRIIHYKDSIFTPSDALFIHNQSLDWITRRLKEYPNNKTVVVTHHAPSMKSHNDRHSSGLQDAYCSSLEYVMEFNPHIKYWIHGHTHDNVNYKINETTVFSNQCGYHGEESYRYFQPAVIEI